MYVGEVVITDVPDLVVLSEKKHEKPWRMGDRRNHDSTHVCEGFVAKRKGEEGRDKRKRR